MSLPVPAQPSSFTRRFVLRLQELGRDTESGAAMVEFVLVFPVQLFLTLAVIQFAFICHAHIVVAQAAFMGARAAAVADGLGDGGGPAVLRAAAMREVARTVAVLSSGDPPDTPAPPLADLGPEANTDLEWSAATDTGVMRFPEGRQQEAYTHLQGGDPGDPAEVAILDLTTDAQHGYVSCSVKYDYVMLIPVANHIFARAGGFVFGSGGDYRPGSQARNRTVFRVHRVGFIPTPWTRGPGAGSMVATTPTEPP